MLILSWVYVLLCFGHFPAHSNSVWIGGMFEAVQSSLLEPRHFCHLCTSSHPYSHSKTLFKFKPQIPPKLSNLPILHLYCFFFFSVHFDIGWNIWSRSLALISMLCPTSFSIVLQGWIGNFTRILYCFFGFLSPCDGLWFDSLFGFVLVAGENMSIYTQLLFIYSFLILSKPSKHILVFINSDSIVRTG